MFKNMIKLVTREQTLNNVVPAVGFLLIEPKYAASIFILQLLQCAVCSGVPDSKDLHRYYTHWGVLEGNTMV